MARTKQTARREVGGKAPRRSHASRHLSRKSVDTNGLDIVVEGAKSDDEEVVSNNNILANTHHIQHAKLFELTNWNRDYVIAAESNKNTTYLAHWLLIAQEQPETIDERLVTIIKLKSFSDYSLASHGEIVADLRVLGVEYIAGMTRFAAIVTCIILRTPSFSNNPSCKRLVSELTPGL